MIHFPLTPHISYLRLLLLHRIVTLDILTLLNEINALKELEHFVDQTKLMLANIWSDWGRERTHIIGALIHNTAFHSLTSSGITLNSPCKNGT